MRFPRLAAVVCASAIYVLLDLHQCNGDDSTVAEVLDIWSAKRKQMSTVTLRAAGKIFIPKHSRLHPMHNDGVLSCPTSDVQDRIEAELHLDFKEGRARFDILEPVQDVFSGEFRPFTGIHAHDRKSMWEVTLNANPGVGGVPKNAISRQVTLHRRPVPERTQMSLPEATWPLLFACGVVSLTAPNEVSYLFEPLQPESIAIRSTRLPSKGGESDLVLLSASPFEQYKTEVLVDRSKQGAVVQYSTTINGRPNISITIDYALSDAGWVPSHWKSTQTLQPFGLLSVQDFDVSAFIRGESLSSDQFQPDIRPGDLVYDVVRKTSYAQTSEGIVTEEDFKSHGFHPRGGYIGWYIAIGVVMLLGYLVFYARRRS